MDSAKQIRQLIRETLNGDPNMNTEISKLNELIEYYKTQVHLNNTSWWEVNRIIFNTKLNSQQKLQSIIDRYETLLDRIKSLEYPSFSK
jgi:hypothetical protein